MKTYILSIRTKEFKETWNKNRRNIYVIYFCYILTIFFSHSLFSSSFSQRVLSYTLPSDRDTFYSNTAGCVRNVQQKPNLSRAIWFPFESARTAGYCRTREPIIVSKLPRAWFRAIESTTLARYIRRLRKSSPPRIGYRAESTVVRDDRHPSIRLDRSGDNCMFNFRSF